MPRRKVRINVSRLFTATQFDEGIDRDWLTLWCHNHRVQID